jgi:hypothetical protein
MKKRVLAGAAALALGLTGVIGVNQASADEGAAPSLTVRAVNTAQGDASAYLMAKCPEHTAKAIIKVGDRKTETINLKNAPSEFGYMISSNQGQAPTSLTCFDYQEKSTNTTATIDLTKAVGPQVTVTGDGVARKAAPGGNITVGATGFAAGQELDFTLYSKPYSLGKATVSAGGSAQLSAVVSSDVIPGSSHYVVVKSDKDEIGLANVAIVNKDDLKKGQPGDNGGKQKGKPGLPRTGAAA